jgi:hypothetical protein
VNLLAWYEWLLENGATETWATEGDRRPKVNTTTATGQTIISDRMPLPSYLKIENVQE